jgi:hypothetical protein
MRPQVKNEFVIDVQTVVVAGLSDDLRHVLVPPLSEIVELGDGILCRAVLLRAVLLRALVALLSLFVNVLEDNLLADDRVSFELRLAHQANEHQFGLLPLFFLDMANGF